MALAGLQEPQGQEGIRTRRVTRVRQALLALAALVAEVKQDPMPTVMRGVAAGITALLVVLVVLGKSAFTTPKMPTTFSPYDKDGQFGTHYLFDYVGDGIRMHSHAARTSWHDTTCVKGRVAIYGDEIDVVLEPGQRAEYKSYRMHEIAALEPGTEIVNVLVFGKPEGYVDVPAEEMCGCVQHILVGRDYLKEG